ncbi:hypothetical protein CDD80_7131 [Ophiocordyceps camponoti-rufipedis]|uniref:Retrovirus-related Pol polyprotein from transposon TNT 1-94-like beta-barrel domain-containing protein n=1 Tax=Ophiocordyceps camponoti-rufipedis TaxID=2004952 RepID=A0A2C5YJJ5_9HYPO|nr:hypothetical protein CDD80_7131 [Ophiocordyceps camponoti-rufipedis]
MSLFILTIGAYDDREGVFYSTTASHHIFNDLKWFSSFDRIQGQRTFKTATHTDLRTLATGTVKMIVGQDSWTLSDAYYVPGAPANFLSAWKLNVRAGVIFDSNQDTLIYKKSDQEAAENKNKNIKADVKTHPRDRILLSKCASHHIFNDTSWFTKLTFFLNPIVITGAFEEQVRVFAVGTVHIHCDDDDGGSYLDFTAFLSISMPMSVLSLLRLRDERVYAVDIHSEKLFRLGATFSSFCDIGYRSGTLFLLNAEPWTRNPALENNWQEGALEEDALEGDALEEVTLKE